jgi:hypothetical protein
LDNSNPANRFSTAIQGGRFFISEEWGWNAFQPDFQKRIALHTQKLPIESALQA